MLCVCFTSIWILWGFAFVLVVWISWAAATASVKSTAVYCFGGDGVWISWVVLLLCCWCLNFVGCIAFVLVYIAWILWVMVTISVKLVCIVRTGYHKCEIGVYSENHFCSSANENPKDVWTEPNLKPNQNISIRFGFEIRFLFGLNF